MSELDARYERGQETRRMFGGGTITSAGSAPGAWEVADWAGTNAWEVVTRIGPRVPRVYVEKGRVIAVQSPFVRA